jgi:large subunit ribosomal protein L6
MSRIGNKVIEIPAGVTVEINEHNLVKVKGPKGELEYTVDNRIKVEKEGTTISLKRSSDEREERAIHGTSRALLNNMVHGVSTGFKKHLVINGVGYRMQVQGNKLIVSAGYSNPVEVEIPKGITCDVPKNTELVINGYDKQLVGEFAAQVRNIRRPEPYKGKGIKYIDEKIRRKEGKTAK